MKPYIALVGCLALAGTSYVAVAADRDAGNYSAGQAAAHSSSLANVSVDKLEGMDIYDSQRRELGDIDEIVKDKSGKRMAVIGLEDSNKEVVVPLDKLSLSADGKTLTTTLSREKLLSMPDYDPMDMESVDD